MTNLVLEIVGSYRPIIISKRSLELQYGNQQRDKLD